MNMKNPALVGMGAACLDKVLNRLDKVKSAGANKWKACCPAHDDKNPSLTISETPDGVVLLKCWAGCATQEIVSAIGLELRDLFPPRDTSHQPIRPRQPSPMAISVEQNVVLIAEAQMARGEELTAPDQARYELAKNRLTALGVMYG